MATKNKRVGIPQAVTINGIDAGSTMTARITAGYASTNESAPDGLQVPIRDKEIQFVRGTISTQDWVHAVELLTGTLSTLVFYERKSQTEVATGYIKHTITNPVIHRMNLRINRRSYAEVLFEFECRAADETKGIKDMWAVDDKQAAPTPYISAARGGMRIISTTHGTGATPQNILHGTDFEFSIAMPLVRECNDSDIGYTCVETRTDGIRCNGSFGFQDSSIKDLTTIQLIQQLITAAKGPLVITVAQSQAAASKVITIANADIDNVYSDSNAESDFTGYRADYTVANDLDTPLTLADANPIITIADAV